MYDLFSARPAILRSCLVPGILLLLLFAVSTVSRVQAQLATTTTLAVTADGQSAASVTQGTLVTLTATVNAGTTPVTQGTVNFCEATAKLCTDIHLLGTAQLTGGGTATVRVHPAVGQHSIQAVFLGTPSGTLSTGPSRSATSR